VPDEEKENKDLKLCSYTTNHKPYTAITVTIITTISMNTTNIAPTAPLLLIIDDLNRRNAITMRLPQLPTRRALVRLILLILRKLMPYVIQTC
jgi:glyceraldehyde-3-phosphate dehydrogenase/erythrose-4-phosphate dehydrogenase